MTQLSHKRSSAVAGGRTGLARALSKLGFCSRSQGRELSLTGRVRVNGRICRDPELWVDLAADRIEVDEQKVSATRKVYLMLNKPRGLVTTASDEQGRQTVFECIKNSGLPFVSPVGRLDKASEGLLLFTNDTEWAARITDPEAHVEKTYHVQVDGLIDESLRRRILAGAASEGEWLHVAGARLLRSGSKTSWLEITLKEGKNRHLRRLLGVLGLNVLRLVRVAIGNLHLGPLPKGSFREITRADLLEISKRQSQFLNADSGQYQKHDQDRFQRGF